MDVYGFANFPFTKGALEYVEALNFGLSELFSERAFEQVRVRGKERVLQAIGKGITKPEIPDTVSAEKELLSYPVARILVSCINDRHLIHRYALAEAKCAHEIMEKMSAGSFKKLIEDFNIDVALEAQSFMLHFTDYIRYSGAIHEPKWKLVNRKMNRGKVQLAKVELSRIIQQAALKRIESGMPLDVPPEMCTKLDIYLGEIRDALKAVKSEFDIGEFKEIQPDCFPPCMVHALSNAQAGVNLPHSLRFALTSFLLNIGMNTQGIIELFKVSPDFDEERTRYQVLHIHGSTGTKYTSPSCATMVTYGNCFGKEPLCERVSHPLGYYRKKSWMLRKDKIANK